MDASDPEPAGVSRWLRSHATLLGVLLALLLLYALSGFVLLPRLARSALIGYVQRDLRRQLSVGAVSFNPFTFTLQIRQFALNEADDSPLASFALLRVSASASSLWHRAWTLSEVRLEQPDIHLLIDKDGSLNLARLLQREQQPTPAPASKPWPAVRIGLLTVHQGQMHFEDRSRAAPFETTLSPIEFSLTDFRTQPAFGNHYRFSAATTAGERLEWSGEFSLQPLGSSGHFTVSALRAATIADYLGEALPFALSSGTLELTGDYRLAAEDPLALTLTLPHIRVAQLAIGPRGSGAAPTAATPDAAAPWIEWTALDVADTSIDLAQHHVAVGQLTLQKPLLRVWRDADGSLNLPRLWTAAGGGGGGDGASAAAVSTPAAAEPAPAASAAASDTANGAAANGAASAAWQIALARLAVADADIEIEDRSVRPLVKMRLAPLALTVQNYSSSAAQPLSFVLDTGIGDGGQLHGSGTLVVSPLAATVAVTLKQFDLPVLQPYISEQAALTLYRGRLSVEGQFTATATPSQPQPSLGLSANIEVTDLATRDSVTNADLITWRALQIAGLRYRQAPAALQIERVQARGPYARVIIGADGELNVSQVLQPRGSAPAPPATALPAAAVAVGTAHAGASAARAAAPAQANAVAIRIGRIDIDDGTADFTDLSVMPNFSSAILGLHGTVSGLSSDPRSRAQVELTGSVDRFAPVSIAGQVNVLSAATFTDLTMSFRNMELTTFNPYSGKYAGYSIEQGKLTTELHYHVENRALQATHHIVIDQLEFGPATDSKQAVPLPVKLAAALLKDRDGVITLDLPVNGSLDDPSFHVAPIVWNLLRGLVEKMVTAPFSWLGSLFGGGEQLQFVEFAPGSSTLADSETQKLDKLAQALVERPALRIDIPLHTTGAADDAALAQSGLEQALAEFSAPAGNAPRQPLKHPGGASPPRLTALAALYRQKFQREPSYAQYAQGADADVPPAGGPALPAQAALPAQTARPAQATLPQQDAAHIAWLEQQLLPQFAATDEQREGLGRARADAAQGALLANKALPPERVFLTERSSEAADDGGVRMELKLQ
jgi:uncharacterized protein involved in outer membrane biogenesis